MRNWKDANFYLSIALVAEKRAGHLGRRRAVVRGQRVARFPGAKIRERSAEIEIHQVINKFINL